MRKLSIVLVATLTASFFAVPTASAATGGSCTDSLPDFDGDGRADLAAGVPTQQVSGNAFAGAVHVIYGSTAGLTASGDQVFHQDVTGVAESADDFENFGAAIASGDFDADGFDDLAIAVPGEDTSDQNSSGAVHVLYGSASGLTVSGDQLFSQDTSGMADEAFGGELFGRSLAACDFDADGRDDLAAGVPGESVSGQSTAGAVHVIYGSATGLTASGDQVLHQDTTGMTDAAETNDLFGWVLAAGDYDGDGRGDLAITVLGQNVTPVIRPGAVHVIYGSATGLGASGDEVFHQGRDDIAETPEIAEEFGSALASGDFDANGRDDLAIGVRAEGINETQQGAVHILYGSADGVTASGSLFFHQDVSGFAGEGEPFDSFGWALAAGDFDGDGRDDLGVGVPQQDVVDGTLQLSAGAVHVIYGSSSGLSASGDQIFHQATSGIADVAEERDWFASALTSADFDADGREDLVSGIQGENVPGGPGNDEGAVHAIYGTATGLTASGDQFLHQDTTGIADQAEQDDFFGGSLVGHAFILFDT